MVAPAAEEMTKPPRKKTKAQLTKLAGVEAANKGRQDTFDARLLATVNAEASASANTEAAKSRIAAREATPKKRRVTLPSQLPTTPEIASTVDINVVGPEYLRADGFEPLDSDIESDTESEPWYDEDKDVKMDDSDSDADDLNRTLTDNELYMSHPVDWEDISRDDLLELSRELRETGWEL
ncbi:hypothetical protein BBJ28_00025570, partial [Nothophytophthora sp. Chile5]